MERLTDEEQQRLVAQAKTRDSEHVKRLLVAMRPILMWTLVKHFGHLEEGFAAIFDDAETILLRWLAEGEKSDKVRVEEGLGKLAWRVSAQASKTWVRARRGERKAITQMKREAGFFDAKLTEDGERMSLGSEDPRRTHDGWGVTAVQALRAVEELPEPYRSTLIAEARRVDSGEKRSLPQILGVTSAAAKQRLTRARRELLDRIKEDDDV